MLSECKEKILSDGFTIINNVFTSKEIELLIETISQADATKPTFRKTNDLFAIRQFLKEVPSVQDLIFTTYLNTIIKIIQRQTLPHS